MMRIIRRLIAFSGEYKKKDLLLSFIYSFAFTIFEIIAVMALVYALKAVVNAHNGLQSVTVGHIITIIVMMVISLTGKIVFGSLSGSKLNITCFNLCRDKRVAIGNRLKRMPMGYFSSNRLGTVMGTVTTVLNEIEGQFALLFTDIFVGLFHAILIALMMLMYDFRVGILSIGAILLGLVINSKLQTQSRIVSPKRQAAQNEMINAVLEYVQGISVIKSFGLGEASGRTLDTAIEESRVKNLSLESEFTSILALYGFVFKAASCGILLIAFHGLFGGRLNTVDTLTLMASSFIIFSKIESVGGAAAFLQMMDENLDKIEEAENSPLLDEKGISIQPDNHSINLKGVSFSYGQRKVLSDINMNIKDKETVAIVGPSGSGKTTLCHIIARFWDVQEGTVSIGGLNVKDYTCDSLLSQFSIVFQKVYLFEDTVLNNIRFAKPDATHEKVVEAARRACCHEFIMKLPNGYDTKIKEGGGALYRVAKSRE